MLKDLPAENEAFICLKDNSDITHEEVMLTAMAIIAHREDDQFEGWLEKTLEFNADHLMHVVTILMDAAVVIAMDEYNGELTEFMNSDRKQQLFATLWQARQVN